MTNEQIKSDIKAAAERVARGEWRDIRTGVRSASTVERYKRVAEELGERIKVRPARHRVSRTTQGFDLELA